MKAIETEYNGYRFRSRLEARWAVFFDALGIKYDYEPEGYVLSDGTRYLPDFMLYGVWHRSEVDEWEPIVAEVKGLVTGEDKKKAKLCDLPVIFLGQIPRSVAEMSKACFDSDFDLFSFKYMDGDDHPARIVVYGDGTASIVGPDDAPWFKKGDFFSFDSDLFEDVTNRVNGALTKARMARFEWGEKG